MVYRYHQLKKKTIENTHAYRYLPTTEYELTTKQKNNNNTHVFTCIRGIHIGPILRIIFLASRKKVPILGQMF